MTLGDLVDYVLEYNEIHGEGDRSAGSSGTRDATQADWDRFWR
jgi:hypothetical protein